MKKGAIALGLILLGFAWLARFIDSQNTYNAGPHPIMTWADVMDFGARHPSYRQCFEKTTGHRWSEVRTFVSIDAHQFYRTRKDTSLGQSMPTERMLDSNPALGTSGHCKPAGSFELFSHRYALTVPGKQRFGANSGAPLILVAIKPATDRFGVWLFVLGFGIVGLAIGLPLMVFVVGALLGDGSIRTRDPTQGRYRQGEGWITGGAWRRKDSSARGANSARHSDTFPDRLGVHRRRRR